MANVLSVDVEEYFQVEAFAGRISCASWESFAPRIERNLDRILEIFERRGAQGTFFVVGWIAKRYPGLVRRISAAGHEIGCHGFSHQHILRQTPDEFRIDTRTARQQLMDEIQEPVYAFRAPSFSIVNRTLWALDILAEEGFRIDSSIFPVRHDMYGIHDSCRFPHWRDNIFEFPPSTVRMADSNWGVGGGGYLRFFPYSLTRRALRRINQTERQPAMVYFHPWELDPDQPRIAAPLLSRLRHYTNLAGMQRKIERLLQDFRFSTISDVCSQLRVYQAGAPQVRLVPKGPTPYLESEKE